MPVKMKEPSNLEVGSYFFAGHDRQGITLYCQVIKPGEAKVINGAYTVRINVAKREIHIPYSRINIPILYEGKPDIADLKDYNAAIDWAKRESGRFDKEK